MKYVYIPRQERDILNSVFVGEDFDEYKCRIEMEMHGWVEYELEDIRKMSSVGDFFCVHFKDRIIPIQIVHKFPDGRMVCMPHNIIENCIFDENSNDYEKSYIRNYINSSKFKDNFDKKELLDKIIPTDVPYLDRIIKKQEFFLPSHENVGFTNEDGILKPNTGSITFDYFKDDYPA